PSPLYSSAISTPVEIQIVVVARDLDRLLLSVHYRSSRLDATPARQLGRRLADSEDLKRRADELFIDEDGDEEPEHRAADDEHQHDNALALLFCLQPWQSLR